MSEWIEGRFGNNSRRLDGGLMLSAWWDASRPRGSTEPPYRASVGDGTLKRRFGSLNEAKAGAERAARIMCERALADLAAPPMQEEVEK